MVLDRQEGFRFVEHWVKQWGGIEGLCRTKDRENRLRERLAFLCIVDETLLPASAFFFRLGCVTQHEADVFRSGNLRELDIGPQQRMRLGPPLNVVLPCLLRRFIVVVVTIPPLRRAKGRALALLV